MLNEDGKVNFSNYNEDKYAMMVNSENYNKYKYTVTNKEEIIVYKNENGFISKLASSCNLDNMPAVKYMLNVFWESINDDL